MGGTPAPRGGHFIAAPLLLGWLSNRRGCPMPSCAPGGHLGAGRALRGKKLGNKRACARKQSIRGL